MIHAVIRMTIPDNQARTAFTTLRRLGIDIASLERADLLVVADGEEKALERAVRADASLFNENTQDLRIDAARAPHAGELWVAEDRPAHPVLPNFDRTARLQSWRLVGRDGRPASDETVARAAELLLCHPVVQRRILTFDALMNGV